MTAGRSNIDDALGETPEDQFVALKILSGVLIFVLGSAGTIWLTGVNWLIQHQVLVASAAHPTITLPHSGGAGLDTARVFVLVCVLAAAIAIFASSTLHHIRNRRTYL